MKALITMTFALLFFSVVARAQSDTLYIKYSDNGVDKAWGGIRHEKDTSDIYPFDGGRMYNFPKEVGNFTKGLMFSFRSYTPEWMDKQFEYKVVDASILEKKDFKGRAWFDEKSYDEILNAFSGSPVIYLVDETQIQNGKAYLVRVYFSFPARE